MQYRLDGETLFVTPETVEEAKEANYWGKWFNPADDPLSYAAWLGGVRYGMENGILGVTDGKVTTEQKLDDRYVDLYIQLPPEVIKPYFKQLEDWTGFGSFFDDAVELTPAWPKVGGHFCIRKAWLLGNGHVDVVLYAAMYDDADVAKVQARTTDYLIEDMGQRYREPEYKQHGNGSLYHNPAYLKRHPAKPGFQQYPGSVQENIWRRIWSYWLDKRANDAAKLAAMNIIRTDKTEQCPSIREYTLYVTDPKGTCNYDGKGTMVTVMRPEDFRKLCQGGPTCAPSSVTDATTS